MRSIKLNAPDTSATARRDRGQARTHERTTAVAPGKHGKDGVG